MRNNTKLKKLLKENTIMMTIENNDIDMIVTNKQTGLEYLVSHSSMTLLFNEALKINKSLTTKTNSNE